MKINDVKDLKNFVERFKVQPGKRVNLAKDYDPGDTAGFDKPENVGALLQRAVEFMAAQQDKLYAESTRGLLIMLQAMDAAGKDGVIKHVMSGLNPQGCQVYSFKAPSPEELDHDYMWRCFKALPERGRIGIFNRSYYEEVLVVRVHPAYLYGQSLPPKLMDDGIWQRRFTDMCNFEQYLHNNGFEIIKLFLNVSKEEQRQRLLDRIEQPEKNWKVSPTDAKERQFWDQYQAAFTDVFNHTSTDWAPWYIVPADHKWFTRIATAAIVAHKLLEMDPQYPTVTDAMRADIDEAKRILMSEVQPAPATLVTSSNGKAPKHKGKHKGSTEGAATELAAATAEQVADRGDQEDKGGKRKSKEKDKDKDKKKKKKG